MGVLSACGEMHICAQASFYVHTDAQIYVRVLSGYRNYCLQFSVLSHQKGMWP